MTRRRNDLATSNYITTTAASLCTSAIALRRCNVWPNSSNTDPAVPARQA